MMQRQTGEERLAERRRLEAVARWCEYQAKIARKHGDLHDAARFEANAADCRWRQR